MWEGQICCSSFGCLVDLLEGGVTMERRACVLTEHVAFSSNVNADGIFGNDSSIVIVELGVFDNVRGVV
jgi:hypothetical protein